MAIGRRGHRSIRRVGMDDNFLTRALEGSFECRSVVVEAKLVRHDRTKVDLARRDQFDRARIRFAHSSHQLDGEPLSPNLRCLKTGSVVGWDSDKHDAAPGSGGENRILDRIVRIGRLEDRVYFTFSRDRRNFSVGFRIVYVYHIFGSQLVCQT